MHRAFSGAEKYPWILCKGLEGNPMAYLKLLDISFFWKLLVLESMCTKIIPSSQTTRRHVL